MNFIQFVEQAKREKRVENIATLRREINHAWVKTKINNHLDKFEGIFTYEDIVSQIQSNDLVASMFCKDPSKQNISENLVASSLGISKLPAGGRNCIRFSATGELVHGNDVGSTKSADFLIDGVYYTQKYTMEAGGAQDNQYHDVVDFLTKGSIKHKVGAIVDGHYWTTKREHLKSHFADNKNVVIVSMDDLKEGGF